MGLFDNFDPNDPRTMGLLMAAANLISGAPGQRKNFGADIGHGLLGGLQGYQGAQGLKAKQAEQEQMRSYRDLQMETMRQQMTQKQQPRYHVINGSLVPEPSAPDQQAQPVYTAPDKPKTPEMGKVREVFKGGNVIQQEWDGGSWREVGQGPRFKPEGAEKPAAPQLYDGPNGPVWITPPSRGQGGSLPVAGPDGQPLGPKKGEKPLSETQAKATLYTGMMADAEKAISGLKFDPSTLKNQTEILLARGELPKIPKVMQNMATSKDAQLYAQSTYQWTEAMLRQLTGAAAPETEVVRQTKTYWPMPGDSKAVIERKNAARAQVAKLVRVVAAGGADKADTALEPKEDPLNIR